MKLFFFVALVAVLCSSCGDQWTQSDKESFYQACVDDTKTWVADPDKVEMYCDCVMIKVLRKYPNVNDAVDNIEIISRDPEIQECRIPILK